LSDLESLVAGAELLSLDAGNTVIFLDHARIAGLLAGAGYQCTLADLVRIEGEAKRALEDGGGVRVRWALDGLPGAPSWGRMIGTMIARAGVPEARVPELLETFWKDHVRKNLWWLVPEGLGPALEAVRAAGVPVVIVSNSEGMLDVLFAELDIARHFDLVVDSGKIGIEKPDARIWQIALAAYPTDPGKVLHLGDTHATDIIGAQALGFRTGLIDPYAHYAGRHASALRVAGVVEVARALVRSRSRERSSP
jgi:HAD superfamily hydrolase (TIGR01509 family)